MKEFSDWLDKVFGIDNNTSATIIITIGVFLLGQLFVSISKALDNYSKRSVVRSMFKTVVQDAIKGVAKQSRSFEKMLSQLHINRKGHLIITRLEFYQLDILNQISFKDAYESTFEGFENIFNRWFCKKIKVKAFIKIWDVLNSIQYWEEKAFLDAEDVLTKFNNNSNLRNEEITAFQKIIEPLMLDAQKNGATRELVDYFVKVDHIFTTYQKQTDKNLTCSHRELVLRMRFLNRDNLEQFPFLHQSNSHLIKSSHYYQQLLNMYSAKRKQFSFYNKYFKAQSKLMNVGLKILY